VGPGHYGQVSVGHSLTTRLLLYIFRVPKLCFCLSVELFCEPFPHTTNQTCFINCSKADELRQLHAHSQSGGVLPCTLPINAQHTHTHVPTKS
jgi:hypothetical protein